MQLLLALVHVVCVLLFVHCQVQVICPVATSSPVSNMISHGYMLFIFKFEFHSCKSVR